MRIVVCVRQGLDGELCPFDACAYEQALRIKDAHVTLLSMGPASASDLLLKLTRLGAKDAVLLCDKAFAGADTLATAYALSLAIRRLSPDLVLCGRQTPIGDTAQTPVMLAQMLGYGVVTNAMSLAVTEEGNITCQTRSEGEQGAQLPALVTLERIHTLRSPRLGSKLGTVEVWDAAACGVDVSRCGLGGSPTRVLKTFENQSGRRKCRFITKDQLRMAIEQGLQKQRELTDAPSASGERMTRVCIVGEKPMRYAKMVSDDITVLPPEESAESIEARIRALDPSVVLWADDAKSKRLAATVAAKLGLGLCADCTRLDCEGGELMMIRPALSGSVIAKIKSLTRPAMATVRTDAEGTSRIMIGAGMGVKHELERVAAFAKTWGAELCVSRRLVDEGYADYEAQVGLTGKTVSPSVYVAVGISGAVHHIVGMERAGTVIAINPDKYAPIFDYADYGIVDEFDF